MRYHGTVVESVMDGWRVSWDETGEVSVHKSNTLKLETRSVRPRVAGPVGMIPTLQPPSLLPPSLLPPSLLPPTNHPVVIPPSVLPPPLPEEEDAEEAPLNNIQFDMELEASEESEESIDEDPDGDDPEERQQFAHQIVEMFEQMFVGGKLIYGVPVGLSRTVHYNLCHVPCPLYTVPYNRDTTSYMGYEGDDVTSCIASEI